MKQETIKTKTVKALPKCDLCGADAMYDAPIAGGSWAYLCERCAKASQAQIGIGTKFILRTLPPPPVDGVLQARITNFTLDEITVECPTCGDLFSLEPDADSGCCQCCGQMVSVDMRSRNV